MTERERLLKKLGALKALADRDVGGEKVNAEERLRYLMQKHNITEDDLEDAGVRLYWIRYKTEYERKLLFQLAYMYTGSGHAHGCIGKWSNRPRKEVGIDCTPAQYIEIESDFDFYRAALKEEMDIFYSAFVQKNNLFPPPELAGSTSSSDDVDLVKLEKMQAMMSGIDRRTRHKALPGEVGDDK